jgi:N-acetylglutamate synthase-like GNAT family acetyltransferase
MLEIDKEELAAAIAYLDDEDAIVKLVKAYTEGKLVVKTSREKLAKIIYDGVMGTTGVSISTNDSERIADKIMELLERKLLWKKH